MRSISDWCYSRSASVGCGSIPAVFVHTDRVPGSLVGSVFGGRYSDYVLKKLKARNGGTSHAEVRLLLLPFHLPSDSLGQTSRRCPDAPGEHDDLHALPPRVCYRLRMGVPAACSRCRDLRVALPERPLLNVSQSRLALPFSCMRTMY